MKLVRWTPFFEPFEEMEKAMEEWQQTSSQGFTPAIDVYETKTDVVVTSPLAGVDPAEKKLLVVRASSQEQRRVGRRCSHDRGGSQPNGRLQPRRH